MGTQRTKAMNDYSLKPIIPASFIPLLHSHHSIFPIFQYFQYSSISFGSMAIDGSVGKTGISPGRRGDLFFRFPWALSAG